MVNIIWALALAQTTLIAPAPPRTRAIPATDWSCSLEGEDGSRFRLSGRLEEVPPGWDPNRSRPTQVDGEGAPTLLGRAHFTARNAGDHFREYQIGVVRGIETHHVNLKLRRGGSGVVDITRFVSDGQRQPYSYVAAGLCTSQFDAPAQESAR